MLKSTSLLWKMILAFLLVAITATVLVAVIIRFTSVDRLQRLLVDQRRNDLVLALEQYYTEVGSWDAVSSVFPKGWFRPDELPDGGPRPGGFDPQGWGELRRAQAPALFGLANAAGVVIVPVDPSRPRGAQLSRAEIRAGAPVTVDGERVGIVLTARLEPRFNVEENLFLQRTNQALILAAGGALLIALIIGVVLARTLISPLHALTLAAGNIARGQLDQQVKVSTHDEIGQLGEAFNSMSQEVARVNQLRRQMTADIAHDLRTPLTVIAGYVESMRDGVLKPTPERLAIIYAEIERLQNLVGDLRMLTQVDAGELPLNPQEIAPDALLQHAAAPFQHHAAQQRVTLQVDAAGDLPAIRVDEARMMQVFSNLLSNALRYTPEGGEIHLSAAAEQNRVILTVRDTGAGIAEEDLPFIFNRFHRADKSRHTEEGESGLGLAIVKALIDAHGGTIWAESRVGVGTAMHIALPVIAPSS